MPIPGFTELSLILLLVVIVFGYRKIPALVEWVGSRIDEPRAELSADRNADVVDLGVHDAPEEKS